jgi:RHS repeat-associated protein
VRSLKPGVSGYKLLNAISRARNGGLKAYSYNTYDAEDRVTQVDSGLTASYTYDASGRRVQKISGGVTTGYLYDTSGNVVTEFQGDNAAWELGYVYPNGGLLAEYENSETVFPFKDHLGSARLLTDMSFQTSGAPCESIDYLPFGEQAIASGTCDTSHRFTGKERDSESGLDDFGSRYYASTLGRFMTTDPVVVTPERLKNPQQLNLYAYVANNPLRFIDPTGQVLTAAGNQQVDHYDLCSIYGGSDCDNRLKINEKDGNITFDTTGLDLGKNEGAVLLNDLVTSKNTYEFSEGPTVQTANGPQKVDFITNLPTFGDQRQTGQPRAGVNDVVALFLNNPKITQISKTNLKVALGYTVAFHELAEAFAKIDGGKGGSYEQGHNAALQRELTLRDQRPYLKEYNTGAGGPANSPNPQGGIITKK